VYRAAITQGLPDLWYGRHVYSTARVAFAGYPFILEQHGIHRRWAVRVLISHVVRMPNCRALVVISEALKRDCLKAYGISDRRVIVAHDAAAPYRPTVPRIRKEPGVYDIGFTGHLYPGKGMEVIAQLAPRLPEVRFHVVGGMESDLGRWRRAGLPANVALHGFVPHQEVAAFLGSFDAVLLPNQRRVTLEDAGGDIGAWTSPLKMFEYMAAGLPIISSDLPVLREVLTDGHDALLVPPDQIDLWEVALRRLIGDAALRASLGRHAREDAEAKYTWAQRARHVLPVAPVGA